MLLWSLNTREYSQITGSRMQLQMFGRFKAIMRRIFYDQYIRNWDKTYVAAQCNSFKFQFNCNDFFSFYFFLCLHTNRVHSTNWCIKPEIRSTKSAYRIFINTQRACRSTSASFIEAII